jgi:curli biogenesis system outer membrane secretion channel CsgG
MSRWSGHIKRSFRFLRRNILKTSLSILAAVAILAGAVASSAAADPATSGPVVAKLQTPVAKRLRPIAGDTVFVCEADTCSAETPASATNTVPGCRELARRVGSLKSFGAGGATLDADALARCNAAARN